MPRSIEGIHHITAIATDPQSNLDFYVGLLGLRLVKKTVNFDDPGTYHFYYGDGTGRPGTILTFFPWPGARRGSRGPGQATATALSIAEGSLGFWRERLRAAGVAVEDPRRRFDEAVLTFLDPDGLVLELVAQEGGGGERALNGVHAGGEGGQVPREHALRGFHGTTLTLREHEASARLLTETMGWKLAGENGSRLRFRAEGTGVGTTIDLVAAPAQDRGRIAAGSVHHVAWRVADDEDQLVWREHLERVGLEPTRVLDRQYFRSIYFREPGEVLYELATDLPGFTFDEPVESLGSELKLPPWLEPNRGRIESLLPPIRAPRVL